MDAVSQAKIKQVCMRIAFLMEHQEILPDIKEICDEIAPTEEYVQEAKEVFTEEYLRGAHDALRYLIGFLEQKGKR